MALTDENGTGMVMPVAPMYGNGGNGGFGNFGGDGWWILILFILLGGWNGNNGFGGGLGGNDLYPWMNNSQNINSGFRDQMLGTQINGIQNGITAGFGDVQNSICSGFAGLTNTLNSNQMADMNRSFDAQTSMLQGFNAMQAQLSQCCCDNRLATCQTQNIVQNEGAATRLAIQQQTQAILDKMCQQEIDTLKANNLELQNRLNMTNLAASQYQQTQQILAAIEAPAA